MQCKKKYCVCSQNICTEILNKSSSKKREKREVHDPSANENNTDNTISWLVLKIIMLTCSNEIKYRQCLLRRLRGLTPDPAHFLEAAPSSGGCVVRLLACRWPDAFLILLYPRGSLESEAWQRNKSFKPAHGFTGYHSDLQRRGMKLYQLQAFTSQLSKTLEIGVHF